MVFLSALEVGDVFRVVHPDQMSENKRKMSTSATYKVSKIYPMAPGMYISVDLAEESGFYSLLPSTPVAYVEERQYNREEVCHFLGKKINSTVTLGYRFFWDGDEKVFSIIPRESQKLLKIIYALGKTEFTPPEMRIALKGIGFFAMVPLLRFGLVEKITARKVNSKFVKANIHEASK